MLKYHFCAPSPGPTHQALNRYKPKPWTPLRTCSFLRNISRNPFKNFWTITLVSQPQPPKTPFLGVLKYPVAPCSKNSHRDTLRTPVPPSCPLEIHLSALTEISSIHLFGFKHPNVNGWLVLCLHSRMLFLFRYLEEFEAILYCSRSSLNLLVARSCMESILSVVAAI